MSYTASSQFEQYENEFRASSDGFSTLTDQQILNVEPVQLQLITTSRTAAFSELIPANLPMNITPQDLAIVNQVNLDQQIEAGTMLKIPVQ